MALSHSLAIARTSLRLQLADPGTPLVMMIVPLVLIPFLIPGAQAQLQNAGFSEATGAEQVVPGFAVLFAFLSVQQVVTFFAREYAWSTWDRLRATSATALDIMVGKTVVLFAVQLAQLAVVFLAGAAVFGYRPNGSPLALIAVVLVFTVTLVSFGVLLVSVFRVLERALMAAAVGGMLMAGLGGSLAPVAALPDWVRAIAPVSPAYWALDALQRISLGRATFVDVLPAIAVLFAFALVFTGIAAVRFRPGTAKVGVV